MSCTTSFCSLISFRDVRAFISGGCMSVGPKTIPRFSAFIKLYFSKRVTLQDTRLVCKTAPWSTKLPILPLWPSSLTSSGEPSGNAESHNGLAAAAVNSHGWPPVCCQHLEFLRHNRDDMISIRAAVLWNKPEGLERRLLAAWINLVYNSNVMTGMGRSLKYSFKAPAMMLMSA